MLDKLVAYVGTRRRPVDDPAYTASQSILKVRLSNQNAKCLTVIFPPWYGAEKAVNVLERRLQRAGSATLTFDLHGQILRPDVQGVIDSFTFIEQQAAAEIEKLLARHAYSSVHMIGISIGGLPMALLARNMQATTKVTFVVGGSKFAAPVWEGARTQVVRRGFEKKGIGLAQLSAAWSDLDPHLCAPALKGKSVCLYVSETDTFVPVKYQNELVAALRKSGASVEEHRSRRGHAATIVAYCTRGKL